MKLIMKLTPDPDESLVQDIQQQALALGATSFGLLMDPVRDTDEIFQHLYVMETSIENGERLVEHFTGMPGVKHIYSPPDRRPL